MVADRFAGKNVLITGGLGMIGSSLAHRLAPAGATVTLVARSAAPAVNLAGVEDRVRVVEMDAGDPALADVVRGQDYVFDLAGKGTHAGTPSDPRRDVATNYGTHVNLLEACVRANRDAKVLFAGTRLAYGRPRANPVAEDHPLAPMSPYAVNKAATELYAGYCHATHGLRTVCLRITNVYGPRGQMRDATHGIANWFVRQAMDGRALTIFGDGVQARDYIYIDDLVDACLALALAPATDGGVYNVGHGAPTRFVDMARTVVDVVGRGELTFQPFPAAAARAETGDFWADIQKLRRDTGWSPRVELREGLARTHAFYVRHRDAYW
jgi:UDP-glucose 4-epimerase